MEKRSPGRPAKAASEETVQQSQESFQRVYGKQQVLDHDLYKLEVSHLSRDVGYNPDLPMIEKIEHVHFFHTIDSRGRPQEQSNKVGGHFHKVTVGPDGKATCSQPLQEVTEKKFGRTRKQVKTIPYDDHTHEVTYRGSQKVTPAAPNMEFAKVQTMVSQNEMSAMSAKIPDLVDND